MTATLNPAAMRSTSSDDVEFPSDARESYDRDGFIALPQLTTAAEAIRLREIYDDLFARRVGRESGDQFDLFGDDSDPDKPNIPQILGPDNYVPELRETLAWRNAERLLTHLLGAPSAGIGSHMILKPAGSPLSTPWHQDEAYWDASRRYKSMSIWIPLQDVDQGNGCMHFIPGSHRRGIVKHRSGNNDPRVHGLEIDDDKIDLSGQIACPLPAGGCTAHDGRTLHFTSPNPSRVPRRAWIIMGGLEAQKRAEIRSFPWMDAKRTRRDERAEAFAKAKAAAAAV